jgi:hypothetical protein
MQSPQPLSERDEHGGLLLPWLKVEPHYPEGATRCLFLMPVYCCNKKEEANHLYIYIFLQTLNKRNAKYIQYSCNYLTSY